MTINSFCGYVAIAGKPNVGKSTLLNQLIEQKIAITSRRPQTTRHQISGIRTKDNIQIIFIDTPGIHDTQVKTLNRYMNKAAKTALISADAILFVIDNDILSEKDNAIYKDISACKRPIILVVNKVDKLKDKFRLATNLEKLAISKQFDKIITVSAKNKTNLEQLIQCINGYIPQGEHHFPEDQITDRSERFIAAEFIREQIFRQVGDELPYDVAVSLEKLSYTDNPKKPLLTIEATIYVNRKSQKAIIIGNKGDRLKQIGTEARKYLEIQFDIKVMLRLWVKVKSGWADNAKALQSFGYNLPE
jgi:GTP-binding protein Era